MMEITIRLPGETKTITARNVGVPADVVKGKRDKTSSMRKYRLSCGHFIRHDRDQGAYKLVELIAFHFFIRHQDQKKT